MIRYRPPVYIGHKVTWQPGVVPIGNACVLQATSLSSVCHENYDSDNVSQCYYRAKSQLKPQTVVMRRRRPHIGMYLGTRQAPHIGTGEVTQLPVVTYRIHQRCQIKRVPATEATTDITGGASVVTNLVLLFTKR